MSVDLNDFNNLGSLMDDSTKTVGACLTIDISLIDEDINQPRTNSNPGFSEESINELAETIKERGVKSPISVRDVGNGRYLINHGARRYRASIVAGLTEIPAYVDNNYTKLDQVIENIQRNNLTANEIANFISEELKKGKSKGYIAEELGKSNAWVSQYCSIIDLPDDLVIFWESGILGDDVTALSELCKCYKKNPEVTLSYISNSEKISRQNVGELREQIEQNNFTKEPKITFKDENTIKQNSNSIEPKSQNYNDDFEESHDSEKTDESGSEYLEDTPEEVNVDIKFDESLIEDSNSCNENNLIIDFSEDTFGGRKEIVEVIYSWNKFGNNDDFFMVNVNAGVGKAVISNLQNYYLVDLSELKVKKLSFKE